MEEKAAEEARNNLLPDVDADIDTAELDALSDSEDDIDEGDLTVQSVVEKD